MQRHTTLLILALLLGMLAVLAWQGFGALFQLVPEPPAAGRDRAPASPGGQRPAATAVGAAPAAEGADPARLEGARGAEASPRRLEGRVTLEEGSAPLAVVVYLLPKGVEGAGQVEHAVEVDEAGRFDLGELDPAGHWVCATAKGLEPGRLPAFMDGDTWDGRDVELHLPAGRTVRVRVLVEADAPPPERMHAIVTPADPGSRWVFPGPDATLDFSKRQRVRRHLAPELRLPTLGEVRVRIEAPDHRTDPPEVVLAPEDQLASFHIYGVGSLTVEATDAETGADLEASATVTILSIATGEEVVSERASLLPRWMQDHGVRPGRYALLVRAPGYVPASVPDVRVNGPGTEAAAEAALSLDPGAGTARLRVMLPGDETLEGKHVHVEGRRRSAPTPEARAWHRLRPRTLDVGSATVTLGPLDPGEWELVVWAGAGRVGRTEVIVKGGFPDDAEVLVGEGLLADLARVLADAGSDEEDVAVEVRRPDGDVWPVVLFESLQRRIGLGGPGIPTESVEGRGLVEPNAVLGPYPSDEIEVRVLAGEEWKSAGTIRAE